jgi:RNA 2',3'-cyclic 3'-phosphodiesterase
MIRTFLAIGLPEPVLSALRVQQFLLPLPRKVDPDAFHLTLVFLGEQPEHTLEVAHEAFERVRMSPFDLSLQGLGLFGGAKPRAAWAGVSPSEPLARLQAKLEHAARQAGITVEARKFHPHVTLGRFSPPAQDEVFRLERAVAQGMDFRTDPFTVSDFRLFRSHLTARGSVYDELVRYPLA